MKKKLIWAVVIGVVIPMIAVMAVNHLYDGAQSDTPFIEAHERAVRSFVESEGFGVSRLRRKGLWNELSVRFEGASCRPWAINLIGLTTEEGYRYFEGRSPRKNTLSTAAHRPLTSAELAAVRTIQSGNIQFVKLPALKQYEDLTPVRVVAPIRAQQACLECHQGKVGDVLGAFDYHLVPGGISY